MRFFHPLSKGCNIGYADEPWFSIRITLFKFTILGIVLNAEADTLVFVLFGFGVQIG